MRPRRAEPFRHDIFDDWLSLMGYWVIIYLTIAVEERDSWDAWANSSRLSVGIATLLALFIGWAGAIVSMDQVWFFGPVTTMVGDYGSDMGIWVGVSWAVLVYLPL
jgi:purine-cytosine permease-like protein